jgi:DHA1 family bicyclomycin/chloramphenicol resistance-like MFS transporter
LTAVLGLLSGIGPMSTDMYLPSLPDLVRALGGTTAQGQLTISGYLIGFACGQLIYGPLSDRFGRKPILILAVSVYCISSLLCAMAWSIDLLIAARVLQALGGCGAIVLSRAIIRDLYEGARAGREMSILAMVMGVTPILAPIVGGVLHSYFGWRANFVVQLLAGLEGIALVIWYLPETLRERSPQGMWVGTMLHSYAVIFRNLSFLAHCSIIVFAYSGLFAWISVAAFVLQDIYKLTPVSFSIVFSVGAAGFITGTTLASRIVVRLGLGRVIGLGCLSMTVGGTIMVLFVALHLDNAWSLTVPFCLYLIGLGLVLPQATAASLMPFPERAGTASSVVGFVQQAGAAACGIWVGHAMRDSAWPMVIAIFGMGVAALLTWIFTRRIRAAVA